MKRTWILACVVAAGLFAGQAAAQEVITTPPKKVSSTPTETVTPATTTVRTGLFGRRTVVVANPTGMVRTTETRVDPMVVPASGTTPATTTQTMEPRTGLFARLRARFGR